MLGFRGLGQPIDRETQVRQNFVVNDIVKENSVRIERFLAQYDAVVESFVVADESDSCGGCVDNFRSIREKSL